LSETTDAYHRSGKGRVIGLLLAGTVLVGGLGAVAGVAFDPEPVSHPLVTPPDTDFSLALGVGRSAPRGLGADSETVDPNMVGSLYDIGFGPQIFVPTDWSVYQAMDTRIWVMNGKGSFAFAAGGTLGSATQTAGEIIRQNLEGLLPPDTYTQLRASGPRDWGSQQYGDVVSRSSLDYQALWTDPQGAVEIYGQIYAAVRNDGAVLVVLIEHVPPDDWKATTYPRAAIVEQSMLRFAGLG
jgi:hypothetical protein